MIFLFQGSGGSDEIVKAATARKVCSRSPAAVLVTTTSSSFSSQQLSVRFEDSPVTGIQMILLGGTAKASCSSARGGNQCPPLHQEEGRLGIMSAKHFAVVIIIESPSVLHCIMDPNSVSHRVVYM